MHTRLKFRIRKCVYVKYKNKKYYHPAFVDTHLTGFAKNTALLYLVTEYARNPTKRVRLKYYPKGYRVNNSYLVFSRYVTVRLKRYHGGAPLRLIKRKNSKSVWFDSEGYGVTMRFQNKENTRRLRTMRSAFP